MHQKPPVPLALSATESQPTAIRYWRYISRPLFTIAFDAATTFRTLITTPHIYSDGLNIPKTARSRPTMILSHKSTGLLVTPDADGRIVVGELPHMGVMASVPIDSDNPPTNGQVNITREGIVLGSFL